LIETKPTRMNDKIAIDTNVLIYIFDSSDDKKREIANAFLKRTNMISSQVISEFLNVSKRLLKLPKSEVLGLCIKILENSTIIPVSKQTLVDSTLLIEKYDFQLFDSIIVASALQANCTVLYSEDMQHKLLVEKQLWILNPFV
jgi:predicted nucleic acid-binding protein